MANTIGEFLIGLGFELDDKDLTAAEKKSRESAKKIQVAFTNAAKEAGKAFAVIGAAALGAAGGIFKLVDAATKSGDQIAKGARAAGIAADSYQRLQFIAGRSGIEIGALTLATKKLQSQLLDAAQGRASQAFTLSLQQIGLNAEKIGSLKPEEQIGLIGDALQSVSDPATRTALSMKIFGERAGPQLASLLEAGSGGIAAMSAEAERLGVILGDEALGQAEEFQDQLHDLKGTLAAVGREIGFELLPVVRDVIVEIKQWVVENRRLVKEKIAEFLSEAADAAKKILGILRDLLPIIGGVASGVLTLADALGPAGLIASVIGARLAMAAMGTTMSASLPILSAVAIASIAAAAGINKVAQAGIDANDSHRNMLGAIESRQRRRTLDYLNTLSDAEIRKQRSEFRGDKDSMAAGLFDEVLGARRSLRQSPGAVTRTAEQINREAEASFQFVGPENDVLARRALAKKGQSSSSRNKKFVLGGGDEADLASHLREIGRRNGATNKAIQESIEAGVGDLRDGSARSVALDSGLGSLSRRTGKDLSKPASTDPLSAILGDPNAPDVPFNELTKESTPQVLISNVYNTINVDHRVEVQGSGDPSSVADMVVKKTRDFYRVDLKRASKFATVGDLR